MSTYERKAQNGDIDKAFSECETDIAAFRHVNAYTEYADALHAMGSMLKYYASAYEKALQYLHLEIEIRKQHHLPNVDAAYLKVAILNSYLANRELIVEYAELALKNSENKKIIGTALNVLGDAIFQEEPADAHQHYMQAKELFLIENDTYNLSHVTLSIARLIGFQNDLNSATTLCEQELNKGLETKNDGIIGTACIRYAEIFAHHLQFKKSRLYAAKAHKVGEKNNWDVLKWEAQKFLNQ